MSAESLGIVATWCHAGSPSRIHASPDRPSDRLSMGVGRMGWYGRTLCGLTGQAWEGAPFVRPLNGAEGMRFADFLAQADEHKKPCPKCRAEFNRRERGAA